MTTDFDLTIDALTSGGAGIGRREGKAVFVEDACPGDRLRVRTVKEHKRHEEAGLLEILEPSIHRCAPFCPHFGVCGGCRWQHVRYDRQVTEKTEIAVQNLKRIGGLTFPEVRVHPSPEPRGYRLKARFQWEANGELGYFQAGTHELVPIDSCPILLPELDDLRRRLFARLQDGPAFPGELELGWSPLEKKGAAAFYLRENVQANGNRRRNRPDLEKLLSLPERLPDLGGVAVWAAETRHVQGQTALSLGEKDAAVPHEIDAFWQINRPLNGEARRVLENECRNLTAERGRNPELADLFGGSGNLSIPLLPFCRRVFLVETQPLAVNLARKHAPEPAAAHPRLRVIESEADRAFFRLAKEDARLDLLILDPPREGFRNGANAFSKAFSDPDRLPRILAYLSCNPATQARDLAGWAALGYRPKALHVLDFFPQTPHVESLAVLERDEKR